MKLIYKKPLIFPSWARFSGKNASTRFQKLTDDGVYFTPKESKLPYFNHVEMTGFEMSSIISYKISSKRKLKVYIFCVFPQIRVIPNETRGSLTYHFKNVEVGVYKAKKTVENISINGSLIIEEKGDGVKIIHRFTPGFDKKALIERIDVLNESEKAKCIKLKNYCPQSSLWAAVYGNGLTTACMMKTPSTNGPTAVTITSLFTTEISVWTACFTLTEGPQAVHLK